MAVTGNNEITPQGFGSTSNNIPVTFVNADSTTAKTVVTSGANGSIVTGLNAATTDSSANNVQVLLNNGSTSYIIGTVNVPTLAGNGAAGATPAINLLNTTAIPGLKIDASGNPFLEVPSGWSILVAPLVAVTTAKTLTIVPLSVENL